MTRSSPRAWAFVALAIVSEVSATLSLKGALTFPWLYAGVMAGYVTAFTALTLALRAGMGLGIAYGAWGACGVALTAVASWALFGEPLTPVMLVGIVLVMTGVLCVELGSQRAHRAEALAAAAVVTGEVPAVDAADDSHAGHGNHRA